MTTKNTAAFTGVFPVFSTPFHEDESLDLTTLEKEIHFLFDAGADGIVAAMVSEVLRLSSTERQELAKAACRFAASRNKPAIISVGAESTRLAVQFAVQAQEVGAAAVMAIPPVSVALGEVELFDYYQKITRAIGLPVIVQDASGYVGRPMSIALQAKLMEQYGPDRIQFKPEAAPIGQRLSELRDATGGRARIFEGTGGIALIDSHRRGIVGTMPGADLIDVLVALWKALEKGDIRRADQLGQPLAAMISLQTSLDAFIAVEKHLLVKRGIFKNTVARGPVGYRLDNETRQEVDRLYELLQENLHS
ncbi:MAG: dihydrodipicolinate synthase family protein [Phycisphaerales bacterium]|jgi:4-hydroxy-tetrahydrodipicolinate synthase|nr:dihydrodipicolinate synthase family protein [Phycisphaerales bacterium]